MKPLRILFVTMQLGQGYAQGTEKYVTNLGRSLSDMGHEVLFAGGDPDGSRRSAQLGELVDGDPAVTHLPTYGWMAVNGMPVEHWERLLGKLRPHVIHLANPAHIGLSVALAASNMGIPYIVSITDFWWCCPKPTLIRADGSLCEGYRPMRECIRCIAATPSPSRLMTTLYKAGGRTGLLSLLFRLRSFASSRSLRAFDAWRNRDLSIETTLRNAAAVVFLSKTAQAKLGASIEQKKQFLIPAGLHDSWFAQSRSPTPSSMGQRKVVVGYAGAIARHKGLITLVQAAKVLSAKRNIILKVAGAVSEHDYADAIRAEGCDIELQHVGQLSQRQLQQFLLHIDILVVPSLSPENQPQIMLEAFAMGLPLVCSDVPGARELMADQSFVFRAGDAADLAGKLEQWINNPKETPASIRPISVNEGARAIADLYQRIAASASAASAA